MTVILFHRYVVPVNPTTVALAYLLIVLVVSAAWRLRYAVVTAILATVCFNFFFLPPTGTFTIADPQNWVALFAFLVAAVVASQLAERALRSADIANQRRREVDRLYSFSQRLLLTENAKELLNRIPSYIVDTFGVDSAALFVAARRELYRSSPDATALDTLKLQTSSLRGEAEADLAAGVCIAPVRIGVQPVGSVGVAGGRLSIQTLEAIGSLIAIAIERVAAIEKLSKTEAARQGEQLRSALLDSVTHEFRTPLTSIKASVTGLLSDSNLSDQDRADLLAVIDEETDRLNRLVGEATEMAALDASQVELHLAPAQMGAVVEAALQEYAERLKEHPVEVHLAPALPAVRMDSTRVREVLLQLLDNAAKYSPAGSPISITAETRDRHLVTSVADRGAGIDDYEQAMIFDKFYRGQQQRGHSQGTGMGLSIAKAIIEAHNGTISATSQLGHGSVFSFSLPL